MFKPIYLFTKSYSRLKKAQLKVAVICPYPKGIAPSQRFRIEQYEHVFKNYDIELVFFPFVSNKGYKKLYGQSESIFFLITQLIKGFIYRFLFFIRKKEYDLIYIHREAEPIGPPWFIILLSKFSKTPIHIDFDDAIWIYESKQKLKRWLKFPNKIRTACKHAYSVTCGNDFLVTYAKQYCSKTYKVPTVVDLQNKFDSKKVHNDQETITIGWTGSDSTLKYLKSIVSVLEKVNFSFVFRIIANKQPDFEVPNLEFIPWSKEREIVDLLEIDIGVMPLENTDWEKGKCGFKAIQYMALGIPAVVSDVGVNSEIVSNGENGFLCRNENDWVNALNQLARDVHLRKDLGNNARNKIKESYSIESQVERFSKILKENSK